MHLLILAVLLATRAGQTEPLAAPMPARGMVTTLPVLLQHVIEDLKPLESTAAPSSGPIGI